MTATARSIVLATALCSGCSLIGSGQEPTIASLGNRLPRLEDIPVDVHEQRAITAYSDFLEAGDSSDARPLAMRRIADLNLEAEPFPQTGERPPGTSLRVADSISLYRQLLEQYPDRADNDMVTYQLARAYEQNGQPKESLATLAHLVRVYPDSSYAQEAHFRRGEILFVQKDYRAAEQAYGFVTAGGAAGPFYRQSLYKSGWCFFKQGLFSEALDAYITLLDLELQNTIESEDRLAELPAARREFVADTLRATSLSFAYEHSADSIAAFFAARHAREFEDILYENLGLLYLQQERYSDAAHSFQSFVERHPLHRQAPRFQMRVIETYEQGGFPTLVLQAKEDFVERYQLQGDYWQQYDKQDSGQVLEFLRLTMTDLSRYYHAQAQRTRKQEDYARAAHWYRTFLGSFADSTEASQMNFLLAELLFESDDFRAATQAYVHTAYDYGSHARAAEAGYSAVLAYARTEERLDGAARVEWHRQSIEHALRFATTFPQHPEALTVRTRTAEQLLAIGDAQRAIVVAEGVTSDPAATAEQQRIAWSIQAHAGFDLGDYLQTEHASQQALSLTHGNSGDRDKITELLAAAIYKQGESAMATGDTAAAVGHFGRVRRAAPTASIVATAEYDTAAALLQQHAWEQATPILERLRRDYPNDARQAEITRRLAAAYLAAEQPQQAASEFERIGHGPGDGEVRREALLQAAELHAEAGQQTRATEVYQYYVEQFPQPVEPAIEARQRLADHYRGVADASAQQRWLSAIIKADRQAGSGRTDRTRYLAAQAAFQLAELTYEAYLDVALRLPLEQSLAAKKQLMESALQQYDQAAAYQVAIVTTAATCRAAEIYAHMGEALLQSERPTGLPGATLAEYELLLEEQAYPFEEQAIALHETNMQRIEDGLYDAWIGRSQADLAILVPGRYAKLERSAAYVQALQ
ncbi:MAG TPA: tetratricopeptide repeat protein [Gammaproteobacteria bacterium]|nr:tetratricopeptide repeat protein [Gammaproteobacteria bacterium]